MIDSPQVKIVSDGTSSGTHVYALNDDGTTTELQYVQGVAWSASIEQSIPVATIRLANVAIEAVAKEDS